MLWLPTKQTRRAQARLKRRRRRQRLARLLLALFLLFGLVSASVPPDHDLMIEVGRVTGPHQFDFVDWLSGALGNEAKRRWQPVAVPDSQDEQRRLVQTYLDQETEIRRLRAELDALYAADDDGNAIDELNRELAAVRAEQAQIRPQVETILVRQVEAVLREEGFTLNGQVFTPPAFRFIEPPTGLVLSPRDRIENQHFIGLQPGLDHDTRADIEQMLDRRGDVSSYVTDIGGLGSYPTMVISHPFLPAVLEIIAHEWTHNYFFSFPTHMAWSYRVYPRLTTINETAADIVGKEISRKVITRFYPDWVEQLPPLDESGQPTLREPSEFDLAMRRIRQRVDTLLAEGKIEEAEAYMERERLKLVEQGHNLRRLNQAYFAFHGSYALSPASVDPTGPQLWALRAASPSLKAFVDRVGWLNSYEDYLVWLEEMEIDGVNEQHSPEK